MPETISENARRYREKGEFMNREGQQGTEYHLDSLYQRVVMVHAKNPAGTTNLRQETVRVEGYNPICGDELSICLHAQPGASGTELLEQVQILVLGCSICRASGSLLWSQIQEKPIEDILKLISHFRDVLSGTTPDEVALGEAAALRGVSRFPVRIDCALLPWNHLEEALETLRTAKSS